MLIYKEKRLIFVQPYVNNLFIKCLLKKADNFVVNNRIKCQCYKQLLVNHFHFKAIEAYRFIQY